MKQSFLGGSKRLNNMDENIKKNLISQMEQTKDLHELMSSLENIQERNEVDLNELRLRSESIKKQLIESGYNISSPMLKKYVSKESPLIDIPVNWAYEDITQRNLKYLEDKGLMDKEFDSLFTQDELIRIERELSLPIKRDKWDKWDFVGVFSGAIAGVVADFFTGGIDKQLKDWLGNIKIDSPQVSIDYQGPGFGGPYHRVLSSGHDILRIINAIWQIKNGTFVGLKQTGKDTFEWVRATTTSAKRGVTGEPFETYDTFEALLIWVKHMASDFVTSKSLPVPGMSFLINMPDHEVRMFAIKLYTRGYNLRYLLVQALAPALVEIIVRGYVMAREYKETGDIVFPSAKRLKTTEMLLTSHSIVTAVNVGKVIVKCNAEGPLALMNLNIPSIIMTVRYFIPFVIKHIKRHDPVEILKRNAADIMRKYDDVILQLNEDLKRDEEFKRFLYDGKQIII
jgi:hypothetical protein